MLDHRLSVRGRICHFLATKMSIWCENSLPQDCESLPPILRPLLRLLALQVSARLQRLLCLPWSCPSTMLRLFDLQQNYTWWLCQLPLWLERLGAEAERLAFYIFTALQLLSQVNDSKVLEEKNQTEEKAQNSMISPLIMWHKLPEKTN